MYRTEKERQELWEGSQVRFAEIAHRYPCCDVPTLMMCLRCSIIPSRRCANKEYLVDLVMDDEEAAAMLAAATKGITTKGE